MNLIFLSSGPFSRIFALSLIELFAIACLLEGELCSELNILIFRPFLLLDVVSHRALCHVVSRRALCHVVFSIDFYHHLVLLISVFNYVCNYAV